MIPYWSAGDWHEAYCELAARRLEEPLLDYGNGRRMAQAAFEFGQDIAMRRGEDAR